MAEVVGYITPGDKLPLGHYLVPPQKDDEPFKCACGWTMSMPVIDSVAQRFDAHIAEAEPIESREEIDMRAPEYDPTLVRIADALEENTKLMRLVLKELHMVAILLQGKK